MYKKIIISIFCVLCVMTASAQSFNLSKETKVQNYEFELSIKAPDPYFTINGLNLQLRRNIQDTPWSFGLSLGGEVDHAHGTITKEIDSNDESGNPVHIKSSDSAYIPLGGDLLGAVAEYDLFRGSELNPYINTTMGICIDANAFFNRTTLGVEFLHTLRIGYTYTYIHKNIKISYLTIGLTLGGWPSKKSEKKSNLSSNI